MNPTPQQLHQTITRLTHAYHQLQHHKTGTTNPQTHSRPTPGPRTPGGWATTLELDLTERLWEITTDISQTITPGHPQTKNPHQLLTYLATHHTTITTLDWANDIHEELEHQLQTITHKTNPPTLHQQTQQEPWWTAKTIINHLKTHGHHITPTQLKKWGQRGHITTRLNTQGHTTYQLTQILNHLQKR